MLQPASWYPILPGRPATSPGLSTTVKGQTLGFSPIACSVEELPFFAHGHRATRILLPRGQCAARCRPSWPPALRSRQRRAGFESRPALAAVSALGARPKLHGICQAARCCRGEASGLQSSLGAVAQGPRPTRCPLPEGATSRTAPPKQEPPHTWRARSGVEPPGGEQRGGPAGSAVRPRRRPRHFREALGHWRTRPSVIRS